MRSFLKLRIFKDESIEHYFQKLKVFVKCLILNLRQKKCQFRFYNNVFTKVTIKTDFSSKNILKYVN